MVFEDLGLRGLGLALTSYSLRVVVLHILKTLKERILSVILLYPFARDFQILSKEGSEQLIFCPKYLFIPLTTSENCPKLAFPSFRFTSSKIFL